MKYKSFAVCLFFFLSLSASLFSQSRNMLPRFPEVIIEKGNSESFVVSECLAKAIINDSNADTVLSFKIQNITQSPITTSLKFRVLYPVSESQIKILINGKALDYKRENPRHELALLAGETATVNLKARMSVNYSVDSVRKALRNEENEGKNKKSTLMDDFSKFFAREKFGKRFMVGTLISKWGVFPIDFKDVKIEVTIPKNFVIVTKTPEIWKEHSGNTKIFTSNSVENFSGTIFLPENDKEDLLKTQEILSSERFMH